MQINFADLMEEIDHNEVFSIANEARPPASYLFAQFLPEQNRPDYNAKSGNMTVRATMAGLVGMDSPYPESGLIEAGDFNEETAKIANSSTLSEKALRMLQGIVDQMRLASEPTNEYIIRQVLNWYDKVIVQAHLDTMEYLRAQALVNGAINWKFGSIHLKVDYGIPAENKLTNRTGTASYAGSDSKFWADIATIQQKLRYNVRAIVIGSDLMNVALANAANNIEILSQSNNLFEIVKLDTRGGNTVRSSDARNRIRLVVYDAEGEVYDPTAVGKTKILPFMSKTKMVGLGNNTRSGYVVGQGGTEPVENTLGYTHIGPTTEGGRMGRWGRVYTPENRPYQMRAEGVTNGLPVVDAPEKIVIASSDLAA